MAKVSAPPQRASTPATVMTAPSGSIVVAPSSTGVLANRWKTGPNAQTALNPAASSLKTGPNAQTDLKPTIDRLKTGAQAQTDLTLKRSW